MKKRNKPNHVVLVLLHHPVINRDGELITTSVTNLDMHDLARSARTYELDQYYLVTPLKDQQNVVERIMEYWRKGTVKEWHPDRYDAFSRMQLVTTFEHVKTDLKSRYPGESLEIVMPDARPLENQIQYRELKLKWENEEKSGVKVIVLGTGWGIAPSFFQEVDTFLAPVYGPLGAEGYNHLSVRAAGAVILDRLFGM